MGGIGDYSAEGPADPRRVRTAATGDFAAAMLVAMLAFPFPVARAALSTITFVTAILVTIVVSHILYLSLSASLWGRTPGMYLFDLGFEQGRPVFSQAFVWATGSVIAFFPQMFGMPGGHPVTGFAAHLSGLEIVAVTPRS